MYINDRLKEKNYVLCHNSFFLFLKESNVSKHIMLFTHASNVHWYNLDD